MLVSRHISKQKAHESATAHMLEAERRSVAFGRSSGNARLRYKVEPYLKVFHKVVEY